jgi:hypothetical protein
MSKELVISATQHETRVAIMEDGQLCEIYIEREKEFALVGSLYKGRVTRVLPGMQSAFVDIGLDSDAFLYVSDFWNISGLRPRCRRRDPSSNGRSAEESSEVFPPTTTNGGVVPPPVHVPEPIVAPVKPVEAELDGFQVITALRAETFQVAAAGQRDCLRRRRPPFAPMQRSQHPPFPRNDRGRGGFGNRGGPGGRNRRFGRPGQEDAADAIRRPPRRDLPPIKYASPSDSRRPPRGLSLRPPAARILRPSFCPVNRSQNSKIVFRPLPWRLRPSIPHLRRNSCRAICAPNFHG